MILDENLRDDQESLITLTDTEIFSKIWTSPRMVFKFLHDNHYDKHVYLLLILGGISNAFDRAVSMHFGDNWPLIGVIAGCLISGGILGYVINYIYAALTSFVGTWFGGKANTTQLLRVVAYAAIPGLPLLIFSFLYISVYGNDIFKSGFAAPDYGLGHVYFFYCVAAFEIVLGIWSLVLAIVGISEVQKFSIGLAFVNAFLPGLILFVPLFLLFMALG